MVDIAQVHRVFLSQEAQRLGRRGGCEWCRAREQFIQDGAETKNISAARRGHARGLLGSHVVERAEDLVGTGDTTIVIPNFSEAKVSEHRLAINAKKDVLRLEIAVKDSA